MNLTKHKYTDSRRPFMNARNSRISGNKFDFVLLGDSITEGFNLQRFGYIDFSILNSGISGDITTLMKQRLNEDVTPFSPHIVSFMGGINDIRNYFHNMDYEYQFSSEQALFDGVVDNIVSILTQLDNAGIKTIYNEILPVNELDFNNPYVNQFIGRVNASIIDKISNLDCIIIPNKSYCNEAGNLDLNLTYDGLHLNEYGYQKWFDLLSVELKNCKENK